MRGDLGLLDYSKHQHLQIGQRKRKLLRRKWPKFGEPEEAGPGRVPKDSDGQLGSFCDVMKASYSSWIWHVESLGFSEGGGPVCLGW